MALAARKLIVVGTILAILLFANVGAITRWLHDVGLIPWAQHLRDEYVTGTAITVIAALLILLPSRAMWAAYVHRCPVCDVLLLRRGRYCCECGSRV